MQTKYNVKLNWNLDGQWKKMKIMCSIAEIFGYGILMLSLCIKTVRIYFELVLIA